MAQDNLTTDGTTKRNTSSSRTTDVKKDANPPKTSGLFKKAWKSLDLDIPTALAMAKGGLPPAIALALLQIDVIARFYSNISYLVAVAAVLGMAMMPRAKFLQTMLVSVVFVCIGAAMLMLIIYCSYQARIHIGGVPSPSGAATYNSSASAVSGIWLFFLTWLINTFRAKVPQFNLPAILISIFTSVGATTAPQFTTLSQGVTFLKSIFEAFLSGFAVATFVSLFVLPFTSRKVVFKEVVGYSVALSTALKAEAEYFESLEAGDMFAPAPFTDGDQHKKKGEKNQTTTADDEMNEKIKAVKEATKKLTGIHGKLHGDMSFAKREVAWGHLTPEDLSKMFKLLRAIMLPTVCLSAMSDIFRRAGEYNIFRDYEGMMQLFESDSDRTTHIEEWHDIMRYLNPSIKTIVQAMDDGLQHSMLRLKLTKPPKKQPQRDLEATEPDVLPGGEKFAEHMRVRVDKFYKGKELALRTWCDHKGIVLPPDFFEHTATSPFFESEQHKQRSETRHWRNQRQLYLILFMEYLLHATSKAILELIGFAEEKHRDGTLKKRRLILPGMRRMKKWVNNILELDDSAQDNDLRGDINGCTRHVSMGSAYGKKKDPEHLPPSTVFEKVTDHVRTIPRILRSPESAFGFRAACASMSVAIIAFLGPSQRFFLQQRVVWSLIMVTISMTPTAGQSFVNFVLRIAGTAIAAAACYPIYYIPAGHTPGIIIFLWLWVSLGLYLPIKRPEFAVLGIITVITVVLVVGYQLEVNAIGVAAATANGQLYYPIYLLAPYRLATVVCGLAMAFIWTIFPYPISEHSVLRQQLGASLYLLANFYSIAHETVQGRIRGDEGDSNDKNSPARKIEKARNKVYSKQTLLISSLRANSRFQKFEIPFGGRFPKEKYDTIIECIAYIHNFISLVVFASETYSKENAAIDDSTEAWFTDFKRVMQGVKMTTHRITSLLALLSSSVTNSQPLPPYLTAPEPYLLSKRLQDLDKDILSVRHISEPGYAAFAVIQISTRCIIGDLDKLLWHTRELVGELDFSFHVVSTEDSSRNTSTVTLRPANSNREKAD